MLTCHVPVCLQVESMGYHTVFSALATHLIGMGKVYSDSSIAILRQEGPPGSDCRLEPSRANSVTALVRCLCALSLILRTLAEQVDEQVFVQAQHSTESLISGCERLCVDLAHHSPSGCRFANKVAECAVFCGSAALSSIETGAGRPDDHICVWTAFQCLAGRLADIGWHKPVHEIGVRFTRLLETLSPVGSKHLKLELETPSHVTDADELDDIVLLPGQLLQRL